MKLKGGYLLKYLCGSIIDPRSIELIAKLFSGSFRGEAVRVHHLECDGSEVMPCHELTMKAAFKLLTEFAVVCLHI